MPTMHVFDDAGHLLADAGIKIWATMLVPMGPQHPDWQLHVDALQADVALASGADGISLDRATFTRLYGRGRDSVERDRQWRQRNGLQVGEILLVALTLDREQPARASLGKARCLHAEDMAPFRETRPLRADSKLRAAWREFEASVPLWAGCRLLCRSKDHVVGANLDWALLLALAERFRVWAEKHHSPVGRTGTGRADEPLLANGVAWSAPDHALLPHAEARRLDRLVPGRRFQEMILKTPA
jgi:hypothetical protein